MAVAVIGAQGQIKGHAEPNIKLVCPESVVLAGNSFEVSVTTDPKLTGKQIAAVSYGWRISSGVIAKGAGTDTVTIEPDEATGTITATVEIDNIWFQTLVKSCSVDVQALPQPRLYDEFKFFNQGYVNMVLDGFMVDLENNPSSQGHVLIYPETDRHYRQIERIITTWAKTRRFDRSRLTLVKAEKNRNSFIQMWSVPPGAANPAQGLKSPPEKS